MSAAARDGFLDEDFLVDHLLDDGRARHESDETRNQKLEVHKWLLSLATFRDELSLIVDSIYRQKGKIAEQKMREQTNQLQFLDLVLAEGKSALTEKTTEMAKLANYVKWCKATATSMATVVVIAI